MLDKFSYELAIRSFVQLVSYWLPGALRMKSPLFAVIGYRRLLAAER